MNSLIKVSTINRDEVSFQRNPAGDVEVIHVARDNSNPYGSHNLRVEAKEVLVATIKREEFRALAAFFAQLP